MLQQGGGLAPGVNVPVAWGRPPGPLRVGYFTPERGETFAFLGPRASVPPLLEPESMLPRWSRDFWDTTLAKTSAGSMISRTSSLYTSPNGLYFCILSHLRLNVFGWCPSKGVEMKKFISSFLTSSWIVLAILCVSASEAGDASLIKPESVPASEAETHRMARTI